MLQFFGWKIYLLLEVLLFNLDPYPAMNLQTMSKAPNLKPPYLALFDDCSESTNSLPQTSPGFVFLSWSLGVLKDYIYKCSIVQADFIENYFEIIS